MKPSIRTFLLINLLLSVTLITSLAIIGNLFLAHKDIQAQLDARLIRTTFRIQAFFTDYSKTANLNLVQYNIDKRLNPTLLFKNQKGDSAAAAAIHRAHSTQEFQVWNNSGQLILHSANAPQIPLSNGRNGLSTLWLHGQSWRVYTVYDPMSQMTTMTAERSNYRQELENRLTQDSIIIMLITYPFLTILVWIIVGRGLDSLKRVAAEVKDRKPGNLQSVDSSNVPTEIEPLVSELNSLFDRLQAAFLRNKRFTADAAHELKTPLAALNTQVQVALRAGTPEERRQALLKVLSGVNRSSHVVQQLLTLSRMNPEEPINEPEPIVLARAASEIAAMLAPEAIAKNIDLELLNPDCPTKIMGNATSINILLRNLIDNAIRYTKEDGFVKIDIVEAGKQVILKVIDNGPGIPEELRERVFERFFRVIGNAATGSGLGLGIVTQIAKLHRAEIKLLTPSHGQGLEVQVIFEQLNVNGVKS